MIVYTQENGSIATCSKRASVPEGAEWLLVTNMPDVAYLDAWVIREGKLVIDSTKALAMELKSFKDSRTLAVSTITVEVDSMVFDGDEMSQTRMARVIVSLDSLDTTLWVLANGTAVSVTQKQLKQALRLAGEAQTALWVMSS